MGYPILFGALNSTSQTIISEESGLSIPSNFLADTTCPSENSGDRTPVSIKFGYDTTIGCTIRVNR